MSRRRFLSGTGIAALGLTAPSLLAACGGGSGGSTGDGTGKVDLWLDIQGATPTRSTSTTRSPPRSSRPTRRST
ncbi:hypothetical protein [Dactylosporangium maewongense]|uniref:hypothetical protein n=1 Tax=Dactylosporangium maewongense TaxID=634393 RepID=UPI0031E12D94